MPLKTALYHCFCDDCNHNEYFGGYQSRYNEAARLMMTYRGHYWRWEMYIGILDVHMRGRQH